MAPGGRVASAKLVREQMRFTIEADDRAVLGATLHPQIALSMLRAARDEYAGRQVRLKDHVGDLGASGALG